MPQRNTYTAPLRKYDNPAAPSTSLYDVILPQTTAAAVEMPDGKTTVAQAMEKHAHSGKPDDGARIPVANVDGAVHRAGDTMTGPLILGEAANTAARNLFVRRLTSSGLPFDAILSLGTDGAMYITQRKYADTSLSSILSSNALEIDKNGVLTYNGAKLPTGETGLWTPLLEGDSVAGSATYTVQTGRYVKIGTLVWAYFRLAVTKGQTSTGNLMIAGLPFPPLLSSNYNPPMTWARYGGITFPAGCTHLGGLLIGHTLRPYAMGSGTAGGVPITTDHMGASAVILEGTAQYETA